jgi:hypothetical protein
MTTREAQAALELLEHFTGITPMPVERLAETAEYLRHRAHRVLDAGLRADRLASALAAQSAAIDEEVRCRVCGCREDRPCAGGCCWVPDPLMLGDLCSVCLPKQLHAEVLGEVAAAGSGRFTDPASGELVAQALAGNPLLSRETLVRIAAVAVHLAAHTVVSIPDPEPDRTLA